MKIKCVEVQTNLDTETGKIESSARFDGDGDDYSYVSIKCEKDQYVVGQLYEFTVTPIAQ